MDAAVQLLQRLLHRSHEFLDRLLTFFEVSLGALLELAERLRGEVEERLIVRLQRLRGHCTKRGRELFLRLIQHAELLREHRTLGLQLRLEAGDLRFQLRVRAVLCLTQAGGFAERSLELRYASR